MPRLKWGSRRLKRLRKLVLAGKNDREIADIMKANRQLVGIHRRRLGLASPGNRSEGSRKKQAAIMSEQNKGVPSDLARCQAARMGWPGVDSPRMAYILDMLLKEPSTVQTVAEKMGVNSNTASKYIRGLACSGLIVPIGKNNDHKTRPRIIWKLAAGVKKHETRINHKYEYERRDAD